MILFLCALRPEARPLIDHYGLKALRHDGPFPVYANDSMALVISGVGCMAMAAATGYAQALYADQELVWINVGIAGHKTFERGTVVQALQVRDQTGAVYYPVDVLKTNPITTASALMSVASVCKDYPDSILVDMEAAGFMLAALKNTTGEWVHVIKIISDNATTGLDDISVQLIESLVQGALSQIVAFVSAMDEASIAHQRVSALPLIYEQALQRWSFSVSLQRRWQRLSQRWQVLRHVWPLELSRYEDCETGKAFLNTLEADLDANSMAGLAHAIQANDVSEHGIG